MSSQRVFGNTVGDLSNILKQEKLDRALQSVDILRIQGIAVSEDFIYSLLQECFKRRDLNAGKQVHSLMISSGLSSVAFLGDHLIRLFAVCGSLADANQIFCNIPKPTTYTWNAIISAHEKLGKPEKALALYHKMLQEGSNPDRITILCVLKACSSLRATGQGKRIHDLVISSGLESDMLVGNMLVNMYAKCGNLDMACILFENLPNRDVVSWGALIGGYAQHGLGQSALELFERMVEEGITPNRVIYLCTLKACGRIGDGRQGRLIHDKMISNGFQSDAVIGNSLIDMYTKCGSLKEAEQMFHLLPSRDVVSYTAMISGYAEHGPCFPALELFEILIKEGIKPNTFIFVCMLKICSEVGILGKGRQIHNYICKIGVEIDAIIGNTLLDMYVKCGSLHEACRIFDLLPTRNAVSWGILIAEYVKHGHGFLALESFEKMQEVSIKPNKVILLCVLKACSSIRAIGQGKVLHDQIISCGLDLDVVVGSTIVDMYAKCGSVNEAQVVFNKLPVRNVVSWGALIAGYAEHGHSLNALELFENMQEDGVNPDKVTFLSILKACGSIHEVWQGRLIHEQIIRNECEADFIVGNALVDMYAKCGILEEACNVFHAMKNRDVVSWGALITGYVEQEHALHALELFGNMLDDGLKVNKVIFLGILKACSGIGRIEQGRIIHEQILRSGLGSDVVVGSSLIDMYAKCGEIDEAHKVFDRLSDRNVVSWGAMIAGYVQHRCSLHAFRLLERMQQEGIQPNKVVFLCVLKACSSIEAIGQGRFIHDLITRSGLESDVYIGSTLVDIYAKCEKLEEAQKVFDGLPARNSVAWAAMITGYAMHGHDLLALHLFEEMEEEGIQPEKVTFLSVLKACGSVGAIGQGRQVHGAIIRCGLELDLVTGNSLVDMYASCGSVEEAQKVFDGLVARDIVSWGAMISGYARHGNPMQARQCLQVMQRENVVPDAVIFTSVLTACTQAGLLDEGRWYFNSMRHEYGITPTMEHFNCLVDLLGRAGHLIEAEELLQTMPILPDSIGWRSLLTACRTYGNLLLGGRCFDQIVLLDGNEASGYMLMSYMYADAHMWEDVEKMEQLRKCRIAAKKPGMAWIEVNDKLCEFVVGGTNHIQSEDIFYKLTRLSMLFKEEGHMPILNLVLNPLSLYSGAH